MSKREYKYETAINMRDEFHHLISLPLTETLVLRCLEIIKWIGEDYSDDEVAHSLEDELYVAVLKFIDHPLAKLALKTSDFDFSRWCA